ncbi:mitochondrial carrier domain-containing protein [Cunninghamella echinulata]|nr:mitochondrial carrier domain-containing protein [Cunninghamella echinulata]
MDGYTIFASSIAALTARICTHPMDTIKTRLQANNKPKLSGQTYKEWIYHSILCNTDTNIKSTTTTSTANIKKLLIVRHLYSGLPVTLLFSVPALSVYLSCYEATKRYLDHSNILGYQQLGNHMISGGMAEIMAGTLFTPMEVLKNQLQTAPSSSSTTSTTANTTVQLAKRIYQQEGIAGFFKGYWMGLVVFLPHTMIYFSTYEYLKLKCANYYTKKKNMSTIIDHHHQSNKNDNFKIDDYASHLPWTYYLISSSIASFISSGLSAPLDIIKTRWQVSASDQGKAYRQGPLDIAKQLWKQEGQWRGFTKGIAARVLWAIPTTAISMTVFESIKDHRFF